MGVYEKQSRNLGGSRTCGEYLAFRPLLSADFLNCTAVRG